MVRIVLSLILLSLGHQAIAESFKAQVNRENLFFQNDALSVELVEKYRKTANSIANQTKRTIFLAKVAHYEIKKPTLQGTSEFKKMNIIKQDEYLAAIRRKNIIFAVFIKKSLNTLKPVISADKYNSLITFVSQGVGEDIIQRYGFYTHRGSRKDDINKLVAEAGKKFKERERVAKEDERLREERLGVNESIDFEPKTPTELTPEDLEKNSYLIKMMPQEFQEAASKMMKENPMSLMAKSEVRAMIKARTTGNQLGVFFDKNPKYLDMAVDFIHDKKALPGFISILNKPQKTKIYGGSFLFIMLVVFFLNIKNSNKSIIKRIAFKMSLMVFSTVVNFGLFFFIFNDELKPSLRIFFKYW